MIAEIHNKISRHGTNLHDRLEDQLSDDFFGAMRYLPFDVGLLPVLRKIKPAHGGDCDELLAGLGRIGGYNYRVGFWKNYPGYGEIDILLTAEPDANTFVCGFEVKLHSGLSSDDDRTEDDGVVTSSLNEEIEESKNQLVRYARLMVDHFRDHSLKYLVLLAPAGSGTAIIEGMEQRAFPPGVQLGLLTWQNVLSALATTTNEPRDESHRRVLQDLMDLLEKKGFGNFRSFAVNACAIDPGMSYRFSGSESEFTWSGPDVIPGASYAFQP